MGIVSKLRAKQTETTRQHTSEKVATKGDITKMRKEFEKTQDGEGKQTTAQTVSRTAGMFARGFGDIAKSLSTPSSSRRPKIAQMPARRRDMGIVGHIDLNKMKTPGLRGRDISGRKIRR